MQRGKALATNVNDHLDYFGTITRQVHKLLNHVEPGEMALAPDVAADLEVAALLAAAGIQPEIVSADLLGLSHFARIVLA